MSAIDVSLFFPLDRQAQLLSCSDSIDEIVVPGAPDDVPSEGAKPTLAITKILHLHERFRVRFDDARLTVHREVVGHDVSVSVPVLIPNPVADHLGSARWLPGQ
jgi:hypothetical protein